MARLSKRNNPSMNLISDPPYVSDEIRNELALKLCKWPLNLSSNVEPFFIQPVLVSSFVRALCQD